MSILKSTLADASPASNITMRDQKMMHLRWSFIFFLVMYAFMMVKANWISDPDAYWHVTVGRDIWTNFQFPIVDTYSYSAYGKPWIAKEWLSQVLFYGIFHFAGWSGLAFFACSICALSLTLLFWRFLSIVKWTIAVGLVWIAMPFLSVSLLARPQIFSFLFFAIALIEIDAAVYQRRPPALWLIGLSALWANLHASFPILFVLIGFGACEAVIRAGRMNAIKTAIQWGGLTLGIILSFGMTPYGFGSLQVATAIVGTDLSRYISEWRPIEFRFSLDMTTEAWILSSWLAFIVSGAILLMYRYRYWYVHVAPVLLFAALTMKHIRFCAMFTLVAAVSVVRPIAERFPRFSARNMSTTQRVMRIYRMSLFAALALALSTFTFIDREPAKSITPMAAFEFAKAEKLSGRVYNSYVFGGFLIANGVPTLIDGRTELFFGDVIKDVLDPIIDRDSDQFARGLEKFDVNWALVKLDSTESALLAKQSNWEKIYSDTVAEVFVRRSFK